MYQIDSSGSVTSQPAPAAAGTPGWFTGGNPAIGQAATILDADWFNALQSELLNVLSAAGVTQSKTEDNQVLASLQTLFAVVAGNVAQKFNVAPATDPSNALNLGQFLASLLVNGYLEIPCVVAGVKATAIVQWGSAPTSDGTGKSIATFPIAFPNACLFAGPVNVGNSPPTSWPAAGTLTKTTATFWSALSSATPATGQAVSYIAIGF